jgi:ESS family glutamate:Na+ symporter
MENRLDIVDGVLQLGPFFTVTLGIVVLFLGKRVNEAVAVLKEFSIPDPVTGGIIFALFTSLTYALFSVEIHFNLQARDVLLVFFFTTIGINASLKDLVAGGKPLVILLVITIVYMFVQNFTGIGVAALFDLPAAAGLMTGTVSLIGGHGTAIAWAPRIASEHGISSAMEIGIASATVGLILASLMGGPIAKFLILRHKLEPDNKESLDVGVPESGAGSQITALGFLDSVLAIHLCIIVGFLLNNGLSEFGLQLPLFVTCLFAGILITNLIPSSYPRISGAKWPSRLPSMALIAEISLGTFLAMSLMSMQLWSIIDLAGPLLGILFCQLVIAILINIYIVFPAMGRNYDAAVVCAGFGGISLGSTPTAMANMSAVAQRYGASHLAFIVVPLVCAFFIDLANALIIPFFLNNF